METKREDALLVSCGEAPKATTPDDEILQDEKQTTQSRPPSPLHSHHHRRLCGTVDTVTVIRQGKTSSSFAPASNQARLRNSLSPVVGLLELANAGDFAANVWNEIPVPTHAVALMALGGVFALVMAVFAFRDARASWPNVCLLLEQRRRLRDQRAELLKEGEGEGELQRQEERVRALDVLLDVVWRELGTEAISRFGLDLLLGGGAVMIGVGTLMAIGGADRRVFLASNLLSGYVGNAPLALYALVNCGWSCYICTRAGQHWAAASKLLRQRRSKKQEKGQQGPGEQLEGHPVVWAAVRRRARSLQLYTIIVAVASIMGGAGSLMTATMWYGYVILTPVVVSSILCNIWWRRGLGYDRPLFGDGDDAWDLSAASLIEEMEHVARAQDAFARDPAAAAGELGADLGSLESVLGFIVANDLFEDFCLRLLGDRELASGLFPVDSQDFTIEAAGLLEAARGENERLVLAVAKKCLREDGMRRFQSRERYLAEMLMNYLYMSRSTA